MMGSAGDRPPRYEKKTVFEPSRHGEGQALALRENGTFKQLYRKWLIFFRCPHVTLNLFAGSTAK